MTTSALPTSVDGMLELLTSRGYLAERSLATVTYLSLRMGRPLFLEGEAGVGKTEIAKVLSAALGRKLIRLQCYEGLDVASAVYEWSSRRRYRSRPIVVGHLRRAFSDQAAAAAGAGA
jgi:MoxR-like ATPase